MNIQTITILGAGYVGLTTAALLANSGYKVYAVEPNKERLNVIRSGKSFFYEEGLDPVIKTAIDNGTLIATDSYEESVPESDVVFSSVGTPDNPDGSSNLTYVFSAATQAVNLMKDRAIYVQKSTVPVRTGEKIEAVFEQTGKTIPYVSNPEFLREGTALSDTLFFDRIVVGGENEQANQAILDLYRTLESHREEIAVIASVEKKDIEGRYISTSRNSAELIKVTANAFLALKISFANSIAKLSDQVGADINQVMDAVGADKRIGRAFLNSGRGYGGGCFPKDVSGLISSGLENGVELSIMTAAQQLNESMPGYIIDKTQNVIGSSLQGKKAAVLGLAFKAGTSDVRKSPGVKLANTLSNSGVIVHTYDPEAREEAEHDLLRDITLDETYEEAVRDVDIIVVATEWPEFTRKSLDDYKSSTQATVFVDAINSFAPEDVEAAGFTYVGVGR